MRIPSSISKADLEKAIRHIDAEGVPPRRKAKGYDLWFKGSKYPPKYVVKLAYESVVGKEMKGLKGGAQTNNFLIARGFDIRQKNVPVRVEPEDEDDKVFYPEGAVSFAKHRRLERNPKVATRAKAKRIQETGALICDVCGFCFQEQYGEVGVGFIEAHHAIPVSSFKGRRITHLEEIALVCSNCHRMLHRGNPLLTIATLQKILNMKASKAAAS